MDMNNFLDISESYVRKGQYLYSVTKDTIFKVKKVDGGKIYFEDKKSVLMMQEPHIQLSKWNISFQGYYLVPKYIVKKFMNESPELWV